MYQGIYNEAVDKINNSIVWTHKIQRTYLEHLEFMRKIFLLLEIIFTSLASTATALFAIFDIKTGTLISSVITLFSVIFASILERLETKTTIDLFRRSSSGLWILKCKVEDLILSIKGDVLSDNEVAREVELLQCTFDNMTSMLPTIPNKFVDRATYKLKVRKDEEVDNKSL